MLKRVDVAVYNAMNDAKEDKFSYGFNVLGLAEDGVGYAMDDNNKDLDSGAEYADDFLGLRQSAKDRDPICLPHPGRTDP